MTTNNQFDGVSDYSEVLSTAATDFGSLAGTDLTSTTTSNSYTYTEQSVSITTQGVFGPVITTPNLENLYSLFNTYSNLLSSTSTPPYSLNEDSSNDSTYLDSYSFISTWYSAATNGGNLADVSLPEAINALQASGYLTITTAASTFSSTALQGDFSNAVAEFLDHYANSDYGLTSSSSASQYGQDFINCFNGLYGSSVSLSQVPTLTSDGTSLTFPSKIPSSYIESKLQLPSSPLTNFMNNFSAILSGTSGSSADGVTLFDTIDGSSLSSANQENLFVGALGTFLQNYKQTGGLNEASAYDDWESGAAAYAMTYLTSATYGNSTVLGAYQTLWNDTYPDNPQGFLNNLLYFIKQQQSQSGGFNPIGSATASTLEENSEGVEVPTQTPSGGLSAWSNQLLGASGDVSALGLDPLSEGGYEQVAIVLVVYNKLLDLLNQLQIMTGAQLNMQTFYSQYESYYTKLETNIPTVTGANNSVIPGWGSSNSTNAVHIQQRSDVSQLQSQFTESVKSFRSEVEDMASAQNTAVNQSQEAVTQQLNVAQTLIQQFGTILQSIWH